MGYESLIFDIDGTLWDSRDLVAEGYNQQLHDEGLDDYFVDAQRLRPLFGKVMTAIADELFPHLPLQERYGLLERCIERENQYLSENECRIGYEGIKETLEYLSQTHRLFIVSNSQQGYPELCIRKLGLEKLISGHLCFGDTGTTKGQTIKTLMERYCISSAIYIGDTQGDYEATLEAGIPFLWADYGFDTPAGFDLRIHTPRDLMKLEQENKL